jgi:SET domain-containing protein
MELRVGYNSEETLIIRPEKHTNMARFINGINNSKGTSKANVATVRKLAKGIPTVILYSIRNIRKGESLLYDYNAGNTNCQYDTSNFL